MNRKTASNKNINKIEKGETVTRYLKDIIGFISFVVIFVVTIPLLLYKDRRYNFLEVYLPNVDLIANLLTWIRGPSDIWANLYREPDNISEFTTQTVINYMALLGVTFIIAKETKRENSVFAGWSMAFVMLLATYLLPGNIVTWFMNKTNVYAKKLNLNWLSRNLFSFAVGLFVTLSFLSFEIIILSHYRKNIKKFAKLLYKIPKKLKL